MRLMVRKSCFHTPFSASLAPDSKFDGGGAEPEVRCGGLEAGFVARCVGVEGGGVVDEAGVVVVG